MQGYSFMAMAATPTIAIVRSISDDQLDAPTPCAEFEVRDLIDQLPAPMICGMVLGELVVHGWDLARATGEEPEWDDEVLRFVYRELEMTAEQGREMGVYGDRVDVSGTAPMLEKILGMTGRDPHWTA